MLIWADKIITYSHQSEVRLLKTAMFVSWSWFSSRKSHSNRCKCSKVPGFRSDSLFPLRYLWSNPKRVINSSAIHVNNNKYFNVYYMHTIVSSSAGGKKRPRLSIPIGWTPFDYLMKEDIIKKIFTKCDMQIKKSFTSIQDCSFRDPWPWVVE